MSAIQNSLSDEEFVTASVALWADDQAAVQQRLQAAVPTAAVTPLPNAWEQSAPPPIHSDYVAASRYGGSHRSAARERWRGLLRSPTSVASVYDVARQVAARVLQDITLTVDGLAIELGRSSAQLNAILKRPLPYDRANPDKSVVMLELLAPADGGTAAGGTETAAEAPLFERVWTRLQSAFTSTTPRTPIVVLTGVSGAGKTKVAYDIGRKHALLILARVWEQGSLTPPWARLREVLLLLRQQCTEHGADADGAASERTAALAAVLVLLACHLEWALAVYDATASLLKAQPPIGAALSSQVLREAVLRSQRNGIANDQISALFAVRLCEQLCGEDGGGIDVRGRVTLRVETAMDMLRTRWRRIASSRDSASGGGVRSPTEHVVWCFDEVQALLDETVLDGFFSGIYTPGQVAGTGTAAATCGLPAATTAETPHADTAASSSGIRHFVATPDDIATSAAQRQGECTRGWFYALLVATRRMMEHFAWGYLLCGTSLRMDRELFLKDSPARGIADSMDVDTRLDARALRNWLGVYLTDAAMLDVDDEELEQLRGRPLFGSMFWQRLAAQLADNSAPLPSLASEHTEAAAAQVVRQTISTAIGTAQREAVQRVDTLWDSTFMTRCGQHPQALVSWLYFLVKMGYGSCSIITPPCQSAEVTEAVQRGVLHLRRGDSVLNLSEEPATRHAILYVGNERATSRTEDEVMRALGRRVSGACGDANTKGATAEDCLAWFLVRRAMRHARATGSARMPLLELLRPLLADPQLFPLALDRHTVELVSGRCCEVALGGEGTQRCFLDLLATPGGATSLLHHAQTKAAGADLAFLAQQEGQVDGAAGRAGAVRAGPNAGRPAERLVLLEFKHEVDGTVADMLPSLDMGTWYPNDAPGEIPSHSALRRLLAEHRDWADPVRILVVARPWALQTQHTVAWLNMAVVPQQPLLLARYTVANLGVDIGQGAATAELGMPQRRNYCVWWPSRVAHWAAADGEHPQAALPDADLTPPTLPTRKVRFAPEHSVAVRRLRELARLFGAHDGGTFGKPYLIVGERALTVTYGSLMSAMTAVLAAQRAEGLRTTDGAGSTLVTVRFVA
jgi:hypothetical protein